MEIRMYLVIYLVIINVVEFCMMGIDKRKAIKHQYRIAEKTLFLIAILGGSIGGIVGMQTFRHKTKHTKFVLGFPIILILQVLFGIYCIIIK